MTLVATVTLGVCMYAVTLMLAGTIVRRIPSAVTPGRLAARAVLKAVGLKEATSLASLKVVVTTGR